VDLGVGVGNGIVDRGIGIEDKYRGDMAGQGRNDGRAGR